MHNIRTVVASEEWELIITLKQKGYEELPLPYNGFDGIKIPKVTEWFMGHIVNHWLHITDKGNEFTSSYHPDIVTVQGDPEQYNRIFILKSLIHKVKNYLDNLIMIKTPRSTAVQNKVRFDMDSRHMEYCLMFSRNDDFYVFVVHKDHKKIVDSLISHAKAQEKEGKGRQRNAIVDLDTVFSPFTWKVQGDQWRIANSKIPSFINNVGTKVFFVMGNAFQIIIGEWNEEIKYFVLLDKAKISKVVEVLIILNKLKEG